MTKCFVSQPTEGRDKTMITDNGPVISASSDFRLRGIWRGMVHRCTSRKSQVWRRYGGRGIRVCKEWLSYGPFRSWAIRNGYSDSLSIERKDNDGGYNPDNCKWATRTEQQNNRHDNLRFRVGRAVLTPVGIAQAIGVPVSTIHSRIKKLKLKSGDRFPRRFLQPSLFCGASKILSLHPQQKAA